MADESSHVEMSHEEVEALGIDLTQSDPMVALQIYEVAKQNGCTCIPTIAVGRNFADEQVLVKVNHSDVCMGLQRARGKEGRN